MFDFLRNLVFIGGSQRASSLRVFKNMRFVKVDLFNLSSADFEFFLCFSGKANNNIRCYCRVLVNGAEKIYTLFKTVDIIMSIHPFQGCITTALEGQMEVRAEFRDRCKGSCTFLRDDFRLHGRDTDAFNLRNLLNPTKEPYQLRFSPIQSIRSNMNSGQNHFSATLRRKCRNLS